MEDRKIMITLSKYGVATVWNKGDVIRLKQELRIPGTLLGSLPRKAWQNQVMSLPLLLMPEEVSLLLNKGFAYVTSKDVGLKSVSSQTIQDFRTLRDKSRSDQVQIFLQERENKQKCYTGISSRTGLEKAEKCSEDVCLEQDNCGSIKDKNLQLQHIGSTPTEKLPIMQMRDQEKFTTSIKCGLVAAEDMQYYSKATCVHVPTTVDMYSPLSQSSVKDAKATMWKPPSSVEERSKYAVFCNLWDKGYYITNGAKFGSDYLLYPGDPSSYHSQYIVKIMPSTELCSPNQFLAYGRLASAVKKTFVLAIVNQDDFSVKYNSISWTTVG